MRTRDQAAWAAALWVAAAGCATEKVAPESAYEVAPQAAPAAEGFDAQAFVQAYPKAATCEIRARQLQAGSPDDAWAALKACVRLRGFVDLGVLLDHWRSQLKARPDATELLLHVVAQRGATKPDVAALRRRGGLGVSSLETAVEAGGRLDGRLLLVRGRLARDPTSADAWLIEERDETSSNSGEFERVVSVRYRGRTYSGSYTDESSSFSSEETGRRVQLKGGPPAKVKTDRDYLFLCRVVAASRADGDAEPDLVVVADQAHEVVMTGFY